MNNITIVGRCGQDPEIRYLESGKCVVKFSIAVRRVGKKEVTDWFNCQAWDKVGEIAGQYVKKGHMVAVQGAMHMDSYEKEGRKIPSPIVNIQNLSLLPNKDGEGSSADIGSDDF